jgi:hypothetical protein
VFGASGTGASSGDGTFTVTGATVKVEQLTMAKGGTGASAGGRVLVTPAAKAKTDKRDRGMGSKKQSAKFDL